MRYMIFGLAGLAIGSILGFGAGLMIGMALADMLAISCFEGACGYFAAALGLVGGLVGGVGLTIAGLIVARRHAYTALPAGADHLAADQLPE
jgi:hypothetical protein